MFLEGTRFGWLILQHGFVYHLPSHVSGDCRLPNDNGYHSRAKNMVKGGTRVSNNEELLSGLQRTLFLVILPGTILPRFPAIL